MFFFKPESRGAGTGKTVKAGTAMGAVLVILTALAVITMSCDDGGGGGGGGGGGTVYDTATAKVDYGNANRAVFFDFSTGTVTELGHDFFDIAIEAGGSIIANSGSYGSGVQVYETAEIGANIGNDFSSAMANIKEYTFRDGVTIYQVEGGGAVYQTTENPLGSLMSLTPPGKKSNVYLVKVKYGADAAQYFKVVFSMTMGPTQSFNMEVVSGLTGSSVTTINAAIAGLINGYGWLYFKLVGGTPRVLNNGTTWLESGTAVPQAGNWDLLFTRTDELQSEDGTTLAAGMNVANRSSALLNIYKKVEAANTAGKSMEQVFNTSGLAFSDEVDAIGYSWYTMAGMPPTFSVPVNTFVVKTVEGNYAKFQPATFYGPNNESFYMTFRYLYSGSADGLFSK
jgi:hypothetical protein